MNSVVEKPKPITGAEFCAEIDKLLEELDDQELQNLALNELCVDLNENYVIFVNCLVQKSITDYDTQAKVRSWVQGFIAGRAIGAAVSELRQPA